MTRCLLILILLSGCATSMGHLGRIETRPPVGMLGDRDNPGPPVHGEDCAATLLGAALGPTHVETAIAHALHNTGTTEIRDVELSVIDRGTFLVGERCLHVEGRLP